MKNLSKFFPILIFLVIFPIFFAFAKLFETQTTRIFDQREELSANSTSFIITYSLEKRFDDYYNLLVAVKSFFISNQDLTNQEWEQYISSLNLSESLPAVSKLIYIQKDSNQDSYVGKFIGSDSNSNGLLGFDFSSAIHNKEAMDLARDLNNIVMAKPIDENISLFIPLYDKNIDYDTLQARRDNITGFIMLSFSIDDLIANLFDNLIIQGVQEIEIQDITTDLNTLVFKKSNLFNLDDNIEYSQHNKYYRRVFGTRNWLISYKYFHLVDYLNIIHYTEYVIIIFGFFIAGLLSYIVFSSTKSSKKANILAGNLSKDLVKFKLAVENISEQIVITNEDGIVLFANNATEKITGFNKIEIIGTKAGKLWGGLMTKEYYEKLWKAIKVDKKSYIGEITNKKKSGEKYISEIRISPILDDKGEVEFFVASERDVTKIKKIDEVKTQFISLASHQLRTPLSAVKWNAEILINDEAGKLNIEQKELVSNLYKSVKRMIGLVNNLLNVSTMEAGKLVVNSKPIDIITLTKEVLEDLNEQINKKNIIIQEQIHKLSNRVLADKELIKEVVSNLLSNAVKYSKEGGIITIDISQSNGYIVTKIQDNGIGIPLEDQSIIFNKFSRASNVSLVDANGSGLGLYMSKIIVEASNGKIWFESIEGRGTTFWFSIPVEQVQEK